MFKILLVKRTTAVLASFVSFLAPCAHGDSLTGAGSSAAAPVYRAWASEYSKSNPVDFAYDSIGSSAGLKKIRAGEVDFGASDVAPSESELARDKLVLVPTFVTGAVPVVNLPHSLSSPVRLSGPVLADIFMGRITRWNATELARLNPGVNLPDLAIKPVVRSDGSGTTYYFTDYLSHVSQDWRERFGAATTIHWPDGMVAAKGSEGIATAVKATPGAIGYIDFNYIADHGLTPVKLQNADGEFVEASPEAFSQALRNSEWFANGDFHSSLADRPGKGSWPITMGTFVLMPRVAQSGDHIKPALRFFVWALVRGDSLVNRMNFVRLPDKIQGLAYRSISSVTDTGGTPLGLNILAEAIDVH